MKTTPFYEAAKMIGNDIESEWFCCPLLIHFGFLLNNNSADRFFDRRFSPTDAELKEYDHDDYCWLSEINGSRVEDNNTRVIALLFADLMWRDEHETKLK